MKSTKVNKRRRFSNKKTRRIKRRGGMHKTGQTPKQRALDYARERALALGASSGVSPDLRTALLTTGMGGRVSALLLRREHPWLRMNGEPLLDAARPHTSLPALFEADEMFHQAEQLVKNLPDDKTWRTQGEMGCTPLAKSMCMRAAQLYTGAIERKYLPAYAPLAWMMSRADLTQSLSLCEECIRMCHASLDPFARKSKTDCTALRAYLQYEHDLDLHDKLEMETPFPGGQEYMEEVPAMKAPPIEELHEIAEESMAQGSKYGHALKWLLLMTDMKSSISDVDEAMKRVEQHMGFKFEHWEHCRYCFRP
jgi:hypothetical protein